LKNENTRDKIFRIAADLFTKKGYKKTTVDDICEACNISKRTFYYHLKSKSDILFHYYDYIIDNITPLLIQMLNKESSWDKFMLIFEELINSIEKLGPDINGQILSLNLQNNENFLDLRENLTEIAVKTIRDGQENKQIRNMNNPDELYRSAAYMFTGYQYMWCVREGDFPWRDLFFNSLENIFDIDPDLRRYSDD